MVWGGEMWETRDYIQPIGTEKCKIIKYCRVSVLATEIPPWNETHVFLFCSTYRYSMKKVIFPPLWTEKVRTLTY